MPAFSRGTDQHIVYFTNQGTAAQGGASTLKRYDVATRQTADILTLSRGSIAEARTEGAWILFTLETSPTETALQLIRIDGRDYQTVYCFAAGQPEAAGIFDLAWSPDRRVVAFEEGDTLSDAPVKLLDLTTGHLQVLLPAPGATPWDSRDGPTSAGGPPGAAPTRWLDNTHLYLTGFLANSDVTSQGIYLLDTAQGANQRLDKVSKLLNTDQQCFDYDAAPDGSRLYLGTCTGRIGLDVRGPGQVTGQPVTGRTQTPIYSSSSLGVVSVRCASSSRLLLVLQNSTGDTSQNGVWAMNADGSKSVRVLSASSSQQIRLSRTHSSSASGDLYAASILDLNNGTLTLVYGSTSSSNATSLFTLSTSAGSADLVGWATM
jgi:hypothetical protein